MMFLCDEMLAGLARWLRAAGYDAAKARPGETDRALLEQAVREGRTLLTRDRAILQIKDAPNHVVVLDGQTMDAWAEEVRLKLDVDWLHAPFSRCLMCNTPLIEASNETVARMPVDSRNGDGPFRECPGCGRAYWPGSHVKRMQKRLEGFAGQHTSERP